MSIKNIILGIFILIPTFCLGADELIIEQEVYNICNQNRLNGIYVIDSEWNQKIINELSIHPVTAQVLVSRGFANFDQIHEIFYIF